MTERAPPTAAQIRAIRQDELQISMSIFAEAIGYHDGERVIQALELGERNGRPFVLMGAASAALRYVRAINRCMRAFDSGRMSAGDALEVLREVLPVEMR